jgi:hypothetical protein
MGWERGLLLLYIGLQCNGGWWVDGWREGNGDHHHHHHDDEKEIEKRRRVASLTAKGLIV